MAFRFVNLYVGFAHLECLKILSPHIRNRNESKSHMEIHVNKFQTQTNFSRKSFSAKSHDNANILKQKPNSRFLCNILLCGNSADEWKQK